MAVDLVTIHHEGAGTPSDDPRGAPGGYTYWIGATRWERLRTVDTSYATLHFNHVSLDICLSGNRMVEAVTDNDIALIHGAFMDCRAHGEIVDAPRVQFHKDNNGLYSFNGSLFYTVCPGDNAVARRPEINAACAITPAPAPPINWVALAALAAWQKRVEANSLHYLQRSGDVQIMNDLLKQQGFLAMSGDYYGRASWSAVSRFKTKHNWALLTRTGAYFDKYCAAVILKP